MSLEKKYGKDLLVKMLNDLISVRRFEERAGQAYGLRKIGGFCHLYIGQEAVAVGSMAALDLKKDYVLTTYRDHGHALLAGVPENAIMAELFGKATGCSRGKGGSMHMYDVENHMLGGNGIVGGHVPVATGVGLKLKYKKEDGVVLCYFGDGAIHQGAFHESMNLAAIYKLPVIYVCENNQYGMGTDFRRVSGVPDLYVKGEAYGVPSEQIDGMDTLTVYDTIKKGVDEVRKNPHPRFYEIKTYRYRGHSMSDPAKYRTKEELEQYKSKDPILVLKDQLVAEKLITEEDYEKMDTQAKKAAEDAVKFAEDSPEPSLETMHEDVLVD